MASLFLWLSRTTGVTQLCHCHTHKVVAAKPQQPCPAWWHGWPQIPTSTNPALPQCHLLSEDTKTSGSGPAPVAYFSVLVQVPQLLQIRLWKGWHNTFGKLAANFYSQWQEDKNLLRRFLPGLKMLSKPVLGH